MVERVERAVRDENREQLEGVPMRIWQVVQANPDALKARDAHGDTPRGDAGEVALESIRRLVGSSEECAVS